MKKVVLLVTLGGPQTLGEVNDFLVRFIGRELPPPVVRSAIERYRLIGGGSPLNKITEEQAIRLNEQLGNSYLCLPAFRYMPPFIEDAINLAINSEPAKIIFFILSPFYATVTTGNYIDRARGYIEKLGIELPVAYLHSWYNNQLFIDSWVSKINEEGFDEETFLLFSAHSLPEKYSGDPYKAQIEETVKAIANKLAITNYSLGWQSVPSNVTEPWFSPTVEERIDEITSGGFRKVIQIPVGFTADHIETLYDIDIVHKGYAERKGLEYRRVSSLNTHPKFITALKDILLNFENK
ncbi:MAG: ferrochelatase [bacterium]